MNYGQKYVQGDRIGILVDLINGTLTFYKNGESQGIANEDVLIFCYILTISTGIAFRDVTGPVYPAISLLTGSQKVSMVKVPFPVIY